MGWLMIAILSAVSTLLVVSAIANLVLRQRTADLTKENNKLSASTVQLLSSYEDSLADRVTEEDVLKVVKKNPSLVSVDIAREVLKEKSNLLERLTWEDIKGKVPKDELVRVLRDGNTGHLWSPPTEKKVTGYNNEYTTITSKVCTICGVSHSVRLTGSSLNAFSESTQTYFRPMIGYFDQLGTRVDATDGGPPPCRR
jgi:hypothetical protein